MNFSAFEVSVSFKKSLTTSFSRLREYVTLSRSHAVWSIVQAVAVTAAAAAGFALFFLALAAYLRGDNEAPLGVVIIFLGLLILVIALIITAFLGTGKNIAIMQQFAKDNNFAFHPWVSVRADQGFAFSVTSRRFARNGVTGKIDNRTFWLYEYRFMTGSGRHPYPNIFTVFIIHLDKNYSQTLLLNKKGRLKMIWPRSGMKELDALWYTTGTLRAYTENGQLDVGVSRLLSQAKIDELMQISRRAEVQVHNQALAIFLPGKPVPDKETAEKLFNFAKNL